ncbi:MAG TPA: GNAT family N-acetyltransferase [Lacipirellulaceae bacterium]
MARTKRESDTLRPPEPISDTHEFSSFDSGEATLDDWLRRRALRNEASGGSRTYVVCPGAKNRVVGFYSLAAGAVARAEAAGRVRRNMPDPVPVMVLGRLAVDRSYQGRGLGRAMLRDAILRTIQAANIVGVRAILVHAVSEEAREFYERCGFHPSPIDPMTLMITIDEAERALSGKK